ncbi:MAG: tripartite tricarboxylate transporter substrate-binding protein [Burkholderiales bacterium]
MNRRGIVQSCGLIAALAIPWFVFAQGASTTRIIVGFPAGGSPDIVARLLADRVKESGITAVVESRSGAGGRIAAEFVKNAATDGSVWLLMPAAVFEIFPRIVRNLPFDPVADFQPIGIAVEYSFGVTIGPASPAKTFAEFAEWCRANPTKATFGTPGTGTPQHFIGASLAKAAGFPLTHVPYKGGGDAIKDLFGGQIAAMITTVPIGVPHHQSGRLRLIADSGSRRNAVVTDVPIVRELGFPNLEIHDWFALFVQRKVPGAEVARISQAFAAAVAHPAYRPAVAKLGFDMPQTMTPAAIEARTKTESERWNEMIQAANFKATD